MKTISALVAALIVAAGLAVGAANAVDEDETVYVPSTAADWGQWD